MEEAIHVKFNDYNPNKKLLELDDYYCFDMQVQKKKSIAHPTINDPTLDILLL